MNVASLNWTNNIHSLGMYVMHRKKAVRPYDSPYALVEIVKVYDPDDGDYLRVQDDGTPLGDLPSFIADGAMFFGPIPENEE